MSNKATLFCRKFNELLERDRWGDIDPIYFKIAGKDKPNPRAEGKAYCDTAKIIKKMVTQALAAMEKKPSKARSLYLLTMSGQGDTDIKIVDKETWDWIFSDFTGDGEDPNVPQSQIKLRSEQYDDEDIVSITSGSYENDRALQCCSVKPYKYSYDSARQALSAVKKNGDKIVDEWTGYIY